MIPLNFNQLYYFYKIAEKGSIAEASKDVLVSSPALSMQLKELEEELGTPLFERSGKKLVLTDAGRVVFEYAKDIFNLGQELRDTISDRSHNLGRPKIEIGCQDTIPKVIAERLLEFLIKEKSCKVVLREGHREELLQEQQLFKLDLLLLNSLPQTHEHMIAETKLLCREELIVVGSPSFKHLKKDWPHSLEGSPFILCTYDSTTRQKLDTYLQARNLTLDVIAEVDDKATEVDMALHGFGLITAMKSHVAPLLRSKQLVCLGTLPELQEEIWLVLGKRKIINPIAQYAIKNFNL